MLAALLLAPLLVFHGNVALLEDVYRSVLDLNGSTKATPASARMVAVRLASFLHRAGYALATVRARAEGEQIFVDVDEGRLDKVIFLGGGAFETLRLRLDLNIEHDVFNQPDLERQLRAVGRRLGLGEFAYEIVPVPTMSVTAPRIQLDEINPLEKMSFGLVRPGRPYELHILVQPGKFRPGISPELEIDSVEGGAIGATYHSGRLLFQDDRWELGGRVAGAVRRTGSALTCGWRASCSRRWRAGSTWSSPPTRTSAPRSAEARRAACCSRSSPPPGRCSPPPTLSLTRGSTRRWRWS
ncbi:MAG: hypothetical protein E6J86_06440 [Deltaproteobacteria bacterium]|nr:MAG: hypothetical protein E6J86_06440 [Deltaproteobacteria bacterium]